VKIECVSDDSDGDFLDQVGVDPRGGNVYCFTYNLCPSLLTYISQSPTFSRKSPAKSSTSTKGERSSDHSDQTLSSESDIEGEGEIPRPIASTSKIKVEHLDDESVRTLSEYDGDEEPVADKNPDAGETEVTMSEDEGEVESPSQADSKSIQNTKVYLVFSLCFPFFNSWL
jgi:hypothetical protein